MDKSLRVLFLLWGSYAFLLPWLQAHDLGSRAHYIGGTVTAVPSKAEGSLQTSGGDEFIFASKGVTIRVPYRDINVLEYGQRVDRRVAEAILISPLMLLSKKRSHFLTVGYTDANGRQQAMVFQLGKSDVRSVLVSLEARTGRRVEYQDEEARKAGKG